MLYETWDQGCQLGLDNVVVLLTQGHGGDSDGEEDEAGHGGGHGGLGAAHQATQRGSGHCVDILLKCDILVSFRDIKT